MKLPDGSEQHNIEFGIRFISAAAKEHGGNISIVDMDMPAWNAMVSQFTDDMKAHVKSKEFEDCTLHVIKLDDCQVSGREPK